MNEVESADQIEKEALAWIARLDRHGSTPELQLELDAWLEGDERRKGAFLRAEAIWGKLDRASLPYFAAQRIHAPAEPVTRRVVLAGGSAAAATAAAAGYWFFLSETSFETTLGEVRRVPLSDGSVMVLNTDSRADVAMRRDVRRITLSDGEAWFDVEKDPVRPFLVEAGLVRVRAVGTAFSVRRLDHGADIAVTEGIVEAWLASAEDAKVRIAAGEKASVFEGQPIKARPVGAPEIDRKLAWRVGKIELDGETLAEAVAEFNRYNQRKLILANSQLRSRRIYGLFRNNDPEGFARAVSVSLGTSARLSPDEIAIGE